MDNGIGSDVLSLGLPPLHVAPFFLYVNLYQKVGTDGVKAEETYYEVPHWMNLSFLSYDNDPSSTSEQEEPTKQPFQMGSNGLLLPRSFESSSKKHGSPLRTASPQLSSKEAVPSRQKQLSQTRQLIAGRDIRDIIEACRPRHTGVLPTPLVAMIQMYEPRARRTRSGGRGDLARLSKESLVASEWGAMTAASTLSTSHEMKWRAPQSKTKKQDSSESPRQRYTTGLSPPRVDEFGMSPTSSIASQLSTYGLLGTSYDRNFESGGRLQRCPSLDLDTTLMSMLSDKTEGEAGKDSFVERARKMMASTDKANAAKPTHSPLLIPRVESVASVATDTVTAQRIGGGSVGAPASLSSRMLPSSSGGIGAALMHYRTSSSGSIESLNLSGSRIPSAVNMSALQRNLRHLSDMNPQGVSPLLLPPAAGTNLDNPDSWKPIEYRNPQQALSSTQDKKPFVIRSVLPSSPPNSRFGTLRLDSCVGQRTRGSGNNLRARLAHGSRRKRALNPFRQRDEDEVLATVSHNRRRWTHVFAASELEFRRRTGPNWRSLTAPAILPISVGYFPNQSEVDLLFTWGVNNITLKEFDRSYFSSNKDLLMEMVRQRLTQDFQLVPPSHVNTSNLRRETLRDGLANRGHRESSSSGLMRQFLSMGHRLQVLTYDEEADIIEITRYDAKDTQNGNLTVRYYVYCFCEESQSYQKVVHNFSKFSQPYNWNKFDRIICGDEDREMREGMRFRRIMFGLLPPNFNGDLKAEEEYVTRFQRLLEYLEKLREKDISNTGTQREQSALKITIVKQGDTARKGEAEEHAPSSTPGIGRESMQRFYIHVRSRKKEAIEWLEMVVDSTCHTRWSYRIMLNWLVASSNKVDAQIQLLHRRCVQFGLDLIPFPQITVSPNMFLNVFKAPCFHVLEDAATADRLTRELEAMDYLHDGTFQTDVSSIMECLEDYPFAATEFNFRKPRWSSTVTALSHQVVHRSGLLFVRSIPDQGVPKQRKTIVVAFGNYVYMKRDPKLSKQARVIFDDFSKCIQKVRNN